VSLGGVPCAPPPPTALLSWGLDWGESPMDSGLLRRQPFMIWGGGSCVSGGSALRAPAPHDPTFTGPCPMPWSLTGNLSPSILQWGGALALRHLHPRAALCSVLLASSWGVFFLLLSFSSSLWRVFNPLLSISLSLWWVFLLLLFRWDCEGHGRMVASATCLGGLCFYGHSFVCHS
jgi:hypothetical protein